MSIRLFPEAIERRRKRYKECEWLPDWQVHSAHIAAGAISSLACEIETGPFTFLCQQVQERRLVQFGE